MLHRIALLALAAPRRIVACAVLIALGAAVFGIPVANSLSAGGFQDPTSASSRATQVLVDKFRQSDMQLFILVTDPADVNSTARPRGGRRHRRPAQAVTARHGRDVALDREFSASGGAAGERGRQIGSDRRGPRRR